MPISKPASLALASILTLVSPAASAGSPDIIILDPLAVESGLARDPAWLAAESIRHHRPGDLAGILAAESPVIALARRGPVAGDLVLRGLSRDNIAVTLDGCSIHGACPNRMDPPSFHLSSPSVASVRIVEGPFDATIPGGIGGHVEVATLPPDGSTGASASATAGSFGYLASNIAGWSAIAGIRLRAEARWQASDPYETGSGLTFTRLPGTNFRPDERDRRAFQIAGATLHVAGGSDSVDALVEFTFQDARVVLYPALRMDARYDRSWRIRSRASTGDWALEAYASQVEHDMWDAWRTSSTGAWEARGYMMRTLATSETAGIGLLHTGFGPLGSGTWGLQTGLRRWDADNTLMNQASDMIPDVQMLHAGTFATTTLPVGDWTLDLGGRVDGWRSEARDASAFLLAVNPGADLEVDDSAASGSVTARRQLGSLGISIGIGHGVRPPDPQERYLQLNRPQPNAVDWVGNPHLGLVRNTEATAGLRWSGKAWEVDTRAFHSWLSDLILQSRITPPAASPANTAGTESYRAVDARLYGLRASARWRPFDWLGLTASGSAQRGRKQSLPPLGTDHDLPEIPPLRLQASADVIHGAWSAHARIEYHARQDRVDQDVGERELASSALVHLAGSWTPRDGVTLSVGIENVFDRDVTLHNAYTRDPFAGGNLVPEPGRSIHVRAQVRF